MRNHSRLKRLGTIAIGSIALILLVENTGSRWETVSSKVTWPVPLAGVGDFYVVGNEIMSLTVADPMVTLKPPGEWKNPMVAEPTEAWMNNAAETLNRRTVNFFRGTLDQGLQRFLQAPGQHTAWWHSRDGQVQVIGVGRTSYTAPHPADGLVSQQTRVWKSLDGGRHWSQLDWPEHEDIDQLLFIDARRGYAIGRGPAVRRTSDGGVSWQRIALPPDAAVGGAPGRSFAGVNLDPDGTLRVAYPVDRSATALPAASYTDSRQISRRSLSIPSCLTRPSFDSCLRLPRLAATRFTRCLSSTMRVATILHRIAHAGPVCFRRGRTRARSESGK